MGIRQEDVICDINLMSSATEEDSMGVRILISVMVGILLLAMLVSLTHGWVDLDLDSDGDGLKDHVDDYDDDNDGVLDIHDEDDDGDGIVDIEDPDWLYHGEV